MVSEPDVLVIAIAKGRDTEAILAHFDKAGIPLPTKDGGRKLILESDDHRVRYIMAKPADVATFVEYGAADLGVCGLDVLREGGRDVYEPLLLPVGHCRLSLAGPADRPDTPLRYESQMRVATSFPKLTADFFRQRGVNAEIITLKGSVELAPLVGLADLIVDLVQTGSTLRANGLVEIRTILQCQEVLIANRASYRLKSVAVQRVIEALRQIANQQEAIPA
ncbi:MAG: ATP phosphoribosyltransferase [Caldilineaceae bacterium]|nr:ATP phosphoribosyltransferase [Caldilineaceae bacterium]